VTEFPTLSRRHAAGAESARGLLFTVLGEFVLPAGGAAWTSTLIDVLGRVGVEEKAARQAVMRTAADGWLRSERVGRRSRWWLTAAASELLTEGTERIFGFRATSAAWDGRWLLVLARVPETERPARHRLRTRLAWAGLGSPSPGLWLTPHAERVAEVRALLADAGVLADAQLFVGSHAGGADLGALVRQAWDLGSIEAGYEQFLAEFGSDAQAEGIDPLARVTELVHAWRRFPWTDPTLPPELLPNPWSGEAAAQLFLRRHTQLAGAAREQWLLLDR
jgi:phenylacetic acid degradation operon negative regulatory protein